jgi:hypothetical protein
MAHGGKFKTVSLGSDGKVEVTGPFTVDASEQRKPAVVVFYLVQDSQKVDGEGRWEPGEPEWRGTGGTGLKPGAALASAFAVLALDDPPAFVTFSWSDNVEVTQAW